MTFPSASTTISSSSTRSSSSRQPPGLCVVRLGPIHTSIDSRASSTPPPPAFMQQLKPHYCMTDGLRAVPVQRVHFRLDVASIAPLSSPQARAARAGPRFATIQSFVRSLVRSFALFLLFHSSIRSFVYLSLISLTPLTYSAGRSIFR